MQGALSVPCQWSEPLRCRAGKAMPSTCIKIIGRGVLCLFSVVVVLYLAVELFLHFNAVEISHSDLMPQSNLKLSQMQLDLAGHILHKSKEPRFSPTLWVQDLIQCNNKIASFVAASFLNRTLPLSTRSLKRQVVQLATARRLAGRAAYKDCCNYFFSVAYFGNGVYGLAEASLLYFDKEYTALEQREFTILCLTLRNPILYNPLEERRQPRIQQVADTIQQEFESSSAE